MEFGIFGLVLNGFVAAQIVLGFIHLNAVGVAKDYVVAHMWFNIAASGPTTGIKELDRKKAASARDKVGRRMTPAQIAEAQRLAREWVAKFQARGGEEVGGSRH